MVDIVDRLEMLAISFGSPSETTKALDSAVEEINRLREKCTKQAMILRRLNPEHFPDTYFICGEMGEKDQTGMPAKIFVAPAYGVDFAYEYVYSGRVTGPEW